MTDDTPASTEHPIWDTKTNSGRSLEDRVRDVEEYVRILARNYTDCNRSISEVKVMISEDRVKRAEEEEDSKKYRKNVYERLEVINQNTQVTEGIRKARTRDWAIVGSILTIVASMGAGIAELIKLYWESSKHVP